MALAISSLISLMLILLGLVTIGQSAVMSTWTETPAEIVDLKLYLSRHKHQYRELDPTKPEAAPGKVRYELETEFRYQINGEHYSARQVIDQAGDNFENQRSDTPSKCYVNPADPKQAVVSKTRAKPFTLLVGLFFSAIPVSIIWQTWKR